MVATPIFYSDGTKQRLKRKEEYIAIAILGRAIKFGGGTID